MTHRKLSKDRRGFGLIETLVAMGVSSIIMFAVMHLMTMNSQTFSASSSLFNIEQIRMNLNTLLSNPTVWTQTVANNTSLGCLKSPAVGTCSTGTVNFVLYTAGGVSYFDPATQGFDFNGNICPLSSSACPIKMTMQAQITCPTASPCATPDSVVAVGTFTNVKWPGSMTVAFNPDKHLVSVQEIGASAAAGGGSVVQIKCVYANPLTPTSICANSPLGGPPLCAPTGCPSGYSDAGVSSEVVLVSGVNVLGHCVRTCYK